jgi:hypothetical protein
MSDSLTAEQHIRIHAVQLALSYFNMNPSTGKDFFEIVEAMYLFIKGVTNE